MAEFKILEEISAYDNEDKIIALLEANPTFIVTVDQDGKNIMHFAAERGLRNVIAFVISYLTRTNGEALKSMFNPDKFGNTPLHYACMSNSVETIKDISDYSPDKNVLNQEHRTPFFISSIKCGMTVLDYCLNAFKPDVQLTDVRGANVLHWAVREGNEEKISYLMDIGVNINAPALDNRTPCDVPSKNPSLRPDDGILKTMKEKQDIIKLAFKAIKSGSTDIKLAFSYEKYLDEYGCTLLHQCAKCNNLSLAERFVQYIHNNDKDIFGRTPLRCALIYESSPALIQLFKDNQGVSFELREPNVKGEEANHVQFTNTTSKVPPTTTTQQQPANPSIVNSAPIGNVLSSSTSLTPQSSAYIPPPQQQQTNTNTTPSVQVPPLQISSSVPNIIQNMNNGSGNIGSPHSSNINSSTGSGCGGSQSPLHMSQQQQQQQQNIMQSIPNTASIPRVPSQTIQPVIPPSLQQPSPPIQSQQPIQQQQQQQPVQQPIQQQPIQPSPPIQQQPIQPSPPIQQQSIQQQPVQPPPLQPSIPPPSLQSNPQIPPNPPPPLNMQVPSLPLPQQPQQQQQINQNPLSSSQTMQLQQQPSSQDPSQLTQVALSPTPIQPSPSTISNTNTLTPPPAPKLSSSSDISPPNNSTTTASSIASRLTAENDVQLIDTVKQFLTSIDLQSYIDILEQNGIHWVAQLIEQKENLQNYITKEGHLREVKKYLTNLPGFNDPVPAILKQHNLTSYNNSFKNAKIDTSLRLNLLKDSDLELIGVKKGHRKDILHNQTTPPPCSLNLSTMEYDLFLSILRISHSKNELIENGYDKIPLLANLDYEACQKYGIKLGDLKQIEYELGDIIKQKKAEQNIEIESESPSPSPTVDVRKIGIDNGLGDYIDTLLENGYDTLERIKDISKSDLEDMGIDDKNIDDILNKIEHLTPKRVSKSSINT